MSSRIKTALVTGANSGIGRALVLEFQKRGFKVYATDINLTEETKTLFNELNDNVSCSIMDVTSNEAVQKVRDQIASENSDTLDLLYCNAGATEVSLAVDLTDEQIRSLYELNLFANMRLVREFSKLIVNSKGTIAFSGSVTRNLPLHSNSLYTSSKAALDQYISVLHCEMRNYGVKVVEVLGGYIKTPIFSSGTTSVAPGSVFDFKEYTDVYSKRGEKLKETTADAMDPAVFAKRAVDKIEKAGLNTLRVFEGSKATTIDLATKFSPAKSLVDKMLNLFGLNFDYRKHLDEDKQIR